MKEKDGELTAKVVMAILHVGPSNYSLISEMTGIPAETVRYKIKEQLKRMGIHVHALVDTPKLGLRRYIVQMKFSEHFKPFAKVILQALHELAYLTYFSGQLLTNEYYTIFNVPEEFGNKFVGMIDEMASLEILESYKVRPVYWTNFVSLNPSYFDFEAGKFSNLDFQRLEPVEFPPEPLYEARDERVKVDAYDLMLIAEMQKNALVTVADVAKMYEIHEKTLRYHYTEHVMGEKLLYRYAVNWVGDPLSRKSNLVICQRYFMENLTQKELDNARSVFNALPFLWSELLTQNRELYIVTMAVPVDLYLSTHYYLYERILNRGEKLVVRMVDTVNSMAFTIPRSLFDPEEDKWAFPIEENKEKLRKLVKEVKNKEKL